MEHGTWAHVIRNTRIGDCSHALIQLAFLEHDVQPACPRINDNGVPIFHGTDRPALAASGQM